MLTQRLEEELVRNTSTYFRRVSKTNIFSQVYLVTMILESMRKLGLETWLHLVSSWLRYSTYLHLHSHLSWQSWNNTAGISLPGNALTEWLTVLTWLDFRSIWIKEIKSDSLRWSSLNFCTRSTRSPWWAASTSRCWRNIRQLSFHYHFIIIIIHYHYNITIIYLTVLKNIRQLSLWWRWSCVYMSSLSNSLEGNMHDD